MADMAHGIASTWHTLFCVGTTKSYLMYLCVSFLLCMCCCCYPLLLLATRQMPFHGHVWHNVHAARVPMCCKRTYCRFATHGYSMSIPNMDAAPHVLASAAKCRILHPWMQQMLLSHRDPAVAPRSYQGTEYEQRCQGAPLLQLTGAMAVLCCTVGCTNCNMLCYAVLCSQHRFNDIMLDKLDPATVAVEYPATLTALDAAAAADRAHPGATVPHHTTTNITTTHWTDAQPASTTGESASASASVMSLGPATGGTSAGGTGASQFTDGGGWQPRRSSNLEHLMLPITLYTQHVLPQLQELGCLKRLYMQMTKDCPLDITPHLRVSDSLGQAVCQVSTSQLERVWEVEQTQLHEDGLVI